MLDKGVSLSAIVISQVFYSLFSILGEVPTGIFGDKVGQKQSLIVGYLVNAVAVCVLLVYPSAVGLYITYSLLAFGDTFLSGSKEALLYESCNDKKQFQRQYSSVLSYEVLGFALSALFVGLVLGRYGASAYVGLIILTAVAKLAAALISTTLKNTHRPIQEAAKGPKAFHILKESISLIRTNKVVFTLAVVAVLTLNGEYFMYSVYQPYFQTAHVAPFFIGFVLSAGAFLNFFATKYAYMLEKKLTLNKIILLLNGLLGVTYVAMALLITPIALVGLFIVMNGLYNVQIPIISDYINEHTSSDIRATTLSAISFVKQGVQMIMRVGLGILVGVIGISHTMLIQGIYLLVGASIACWFITRLGNLRVHHTVESN